VLKTAAGVRLPQRVFYGWVLVGLVWTIMGVLVGPLFQGMGVFFVALQKDFGWSRTALSLAFSFGRVEAAMLGPIEGLLTDKFGVRKMVMAGLGLVGLGLAVLSQIQSLTGFYIAFGLIFFGTGLAGFIPLMAAVNNWFNRRRARATALAMTGSSLGGGFLVPVLAAAVAGVGWRTTSLTMAAIFLLIAVPIALAIRNRPEDYGQRPDGDGEQVAAAPGAKKVPEDPGFPIKEAMRTPAFWTIGVAHGLGAMVYTTMALHMVPALTDKGVPLTVAGTVAAVLSFSSAGGQVLSSILGDRFPKRALIVFGCSLQGAAMLVAAFAQSVPLFFLFAVMFGLNQMRVPLLVAIRGEYFGRRNFASILGISQLPQNFLTMVGPIIAGYLFDTTQSYQVAFVMLAGAAFLSALLVLTLKKPVRKMVPAPAAP
jgi:MFS family permease